MSWTSALGGLVKSPNEYLACMTIDAAQPTRLYVGTSTGLYASDDSGGQWQLLRRGYFRHIAIDSRSATIHGGDDFTLSSSSDGGKTWAVAYVGQVSQIVVDPFSSAVYALASRQDSGVVTILETTDRGKTWSTLSRSLSDVTLLAIEPGLTDVFYAASHGDLFKSEDRGQTWRSNHRGLNAPHVLDIALDYADPLTLFVTTDRGVLKSDDGGQKWSDVKLDLPAGRLAIGSPHSAILFSFDARGTTGRRPPAASRSIDSGETWTGVKPGGEVTGFAFDPSNAANVYAALYQGLARSMDGGATWSQVGVGQLPLGYYGFDAATIAVDPVTPANIYAAGSGGITKSVDAGANWDTIFRHPSIDVSFRKLVIDPRNPARIHAMAYSDVYRTDNAGMDWRIVYSAAGTWFNDLALDPVQPSTLYLATNTGLQKSVNHGDEWTDFNTGLPAGAVSSVRVDAVGNVYAGTMAGLFINTPSRDLPAASGPSVSFRTNAGDYVSAKNCGGGFVDANAKKAGPCEIFAMHDVNGGELNDGDAIYLQAADREFLVAENGGSLDGSAAAVRANRGRALEWETFFIRRKNGAAPIRSGDSIFIKSMSGAYVSADGGGASACQCDSRLSADKSQPREWETFVLVVR